MRFETEIAVVPELLHNQPELLRIAATKAGLNLTDVSAHTLLRRSIDARGKTPKFILRFALWVDETPPGEIHWQIPEKNVSNELPVLIAGFGPAGMFAALRLIELGYRPIIVERGKDVRGRRRDLATINKEGLVNPESNYCFGEGGAGTFSDGKLYTRSHKRGDVNRTLEIFFAHGASPDILIEAHPHIGTNKLPGIVQAMRETILRCGGEIHFDTRLEDFHYSDGKFTGIKTSRGNFEAKAMILATGHSARDIYYLFRQSGLQIESKSFAMGIRVEHPQMLIDEIQYHCNPRHPLLQAAPYSLVHQVMGRGVFSFCMCPGGIICPAATGMDEVVVNGWSPSKRDSPFANSGIVVEIKPEDLEPFSKEGDFAGLAFQSSLEKAAYFAGGGGLKAPASRLEDFVNGKISSNLPDCSYLPGISAANFKDILPEAIHIRLREGFVSFGKKMRGYLTQDAVVVGVESRTSSPLRIPRDRQTFMHPQVEGLFPCGEGGGYAGGIVSAAMDGERCAEMVAIHFQK